ncbi:MAG: sporulation integral membrane protein YtvI [Clostridiales bacterium]|nr:sporulation integral membrane protein YtvI [Clostridiales bacterium]
MDNSRRLIRILLNIAVPLLETAIFLYAAPRLLIFFLPFVIGWILAQLTNPLVKLMEKRLRIVRQHSSMMIIVLTLGLVIFLLYLLISWTVRQALELAGDLPAIYRAVSLEAKELFLRYNRLFNMLPLAVRQTLLQVTGDLGAAAGLLAEQIASPTVEVAGTVAKRIPDVLVYTVITILSAYFMIAGQEMMREFTRIQLTPYIPEGWKRCWLCTKEEWRRLVVGYFLAQAKIMVVVAIVLIAGFLILGVNYSVVLGILIAFLDFLPLFGTGTVLIPWAVWKVIAGEYTLAAGLALLYVLTQVIRQTIQPKIVGDTLGLSPMWTLLFLYLGYRWHGVSGMILAVPVGLLLLRLAEQGIFDEWVRSIRELMEMIREYRERGR